ncbi:MAG: baseplate J/gp47 family protein [Zoogloeaceae bacterium]|jgi:phage-related baseplate assembly protein|nr:baseplate J/gp47 family protein [Zoogloeaceae bacterium]
MSIIDLSRLAPPDVVETLDFEVIYQDLIADFRARYPDYSAVLESDPAVKLLELAAWREMLIRARVNDAARSNLLAFAAGTDMDHLAAFYGVNRMEGELDTRLRLRTQLQIAAIAGNGTRERYRARALLASADVVDAAILQPIAGTVDLALWIRAGADAEKALADVREAFAADNARMLGVILNVRPAIARPVHVIATIYRESSAPVDLAEQMAAALPGAIQSHAQLGRDVPRSLLLSWLHRAGVSRVELAVPAEDLILNPDEYAEAGSIDIDILDGGVTW